MKLFVLACALLIAPPAFAKSTIDFTVLADETKPDFGKMHECLKEAWDATNPSDAQKDSAREYMQDAKDVMDGHRGQLHNAMMALKAAWEKHPIVKSEVVAAERSLMEHGTPVREAFRDAGINTLNLLSLEQRTVFDAEFKECID